MLSKRCRCAWAKCQDRNFVAARPRRSGQQGGRKERGLFVGSPSGGADPCRSLLSTLLSSLLIPESLRSEIKNMVMAGNAIRGLRRCILVSDEEEFGGDPPCWAHLFDEGKDGEEPAMTASAL